MALTATDVEVQDHHRSFLPPTSLQLSIGQILVVVGDPGPAHSALALALAGRLVPDAGQVTLDGDPDPRLRQRAVALVDVPLVSEPDDVLPARTVVGEELAMAGQPAGARAVTRWLVAHDLDIGEHRMDELTADVRVRMMVRLAVLRRPTYVVLVLPERLGGLPGDWLLHLQTLADEQFGVLVTVSHSTAVHLEHDRVLIGAAEQEIPS
jgi:ABC-type uncharacterized transport system ATPase component